MLQKKQYRKKVEKMNDKCTLTMLHTQTGEIKEFTGYWSWKELYSLIKKYQKGGIWEILNINFNDYGKE